MLTIKFIAENPEEVINLLKKKHFDAKEPINKVLELDTVRRNSQTELDAILAELNSLSKSIGQLMKSGQKDEAEKIRAQVSSMKEETKQLEEKKNEAEKLLNTNLCLKAKVQKIMSVKKWVG